jgi:hypothetical protein
VLFVFGGCSECKWISTGYFSVRAPSKFLIKRPTKALVSAVDFTIYRAVQSLVGLNLHVHSLTDTKVQSAHSKNCS